MHTAVALVLMRAACVRVFACRATKAIHGTADPLGAAPRQVTPFSLGQSQRAQRAAQRAAA